MKKDIHWGIIGCGDVCEVKSGPAFNKIPHSKLIAVMRRNTEKARDFAQRHQVPEYYNDADQLIANPEVNAVYIATPPAFHEEYALRCINAGKAVYIEKPVATDADSCQRMLEHAQRNKIPAVSAHYRRALPLFKQIKKLLQADQLGRLKFIDLQLLQSTDKNIVANTEVNWRIDPKISGGGLFHDLAPHQLDILYWLFDQPGAVHGNALNQEKKYDAPDTVGLTALFEKNVYFTGLWAFDAPSPAVNDRCTITGEKGILSFPFFGKPVLKMTTEEGEDEMNFDNPAHIQQPFIEEVVRYFRGEADNPCSLDEALVTMEIMDIAR